MNSNGSNGRVDNNMIGLNNIERKIHRQMLGRRVMEDNTMTKDGAKFTSTTKSMDTHHLNMD